MSLSALADAQESSAYFGASVQAFDYQDTRVSDVEPTVARFSIGSEIAPNVSFEAQYGIGLEGESALDQGIDTEVKINEYQAVYFKPELPVNEMVKAYGLLGYAEVDVAKEGSIAETFREYGLSYGLGAEMAVNPYASLQIEYLQLLDESQVEASSLGLGLKMAF